MPTPFWNLEECTMAWLVASSKPPGKDSHWKQVWPEIFSTCLTAYLNIDCNLADTHMAKLPNQPHSNFKQHHRPTSTKTLQHQNHEVVYPCRVLPYRLGCAAQCCMYTHAIYLSNLCNTTGNWVGSYLWQKLAQISSPYTWPVNPSQCQLNGDVATSSSSNIITQSTIGTP